MHFFKSAIVFNCLLGTLLLSTGAWAQDTDAGDGATIDRQQEDTDKSADTAASAPEDTAPANPAAKSDAALPLKSRSASAPKDHAPPAQPRALTVNFGTPQEKGTQVSDKPDPPEQPDMVTPPKTLNPFLALGDEMFLGVATITAWGVHFWHWGEHAFHFEREYGFTQRSSTGGADKTGHFYTSYIIADFLNWRLRKLGWPKRRAAIVGSSVAMGLRMGRRKVDASPGSQVGSMARICLSALLQLSGRQPTRVRRFGMP